MKKSIVLTFVLLTFLSTTIIIGQNNSKTFNQFRLIKQNCIFDLESNIPGISESAIITILQFQRRYPNVDLKEIKSKLNFLSSSTSYPSLIVKAQLANIVLNYPELFDNIKLDSENRELTYKKIYQQISKVLLVPIKVSLAE